MINCVGFICLIGLALTERGQKTGSLRLMSNVVVLDVMRSITLYGHVSRIRTCANCGLNEKTNLKQFSCQKTNSESVNKIISERIDQFKTFSLRILNFKN